MNRIADLAAVAVRQRRPRLWVTRLLAIVAGFFLLTSGIIWLSSHRGADVNIATETHTITDADHAWSDLSIRHGSRALTSAWWFSCTIANTGNSTITEGSFHSPPELRATGEILEVAASVPALELTDDRKKVVLSQFALLPGESTQVQLLLAKSGEVAVSADLKSH